MVKLMNLDQNIIIIIITIYGIIEVVKGSVKLTDYHLLTPFSPDKSYENYQLYQPIESVYEGDDLIYSGSGCSDDEDKCSGFVDTGSGDDLITPIYIPPKTTSTTVSVTTEIIDESKDCDDDDDDCLEGSGSAESLSSSSSYSTFSTSPFLPYTTEQPKRFKPSYVLPTDQTSYIRPIFTPAQRFHPLTPSPLPTYKPIFHPTQRLPLPTRPTGTPSIIDIPVPNRPNIVTEKEKPPVVTAKSSANETAMIIGFIAIILIVIVIVALLFLFLNVKYNQGISLKNDRGRHFRFMPVSGTPPMVTSTSHQSHFLNNTHLNGKSLIIDKQKTCKKKDSQEWYV